MSSRFASNKFTIAECDRCGFQYKLKTLKEIYIRTRKTNLLVCTTCWEPDHPQNLQGMYPVTDAQAVRNPRPPQGVDVVNIFQWGWEPVGFNDKEGLVPNSLKATGEIGTVIVDTINT
jgi:hypothetical protein